MTKTILVVAAHPDDEILGCGGTIARHVMEGDAVHILIMAEGMTSRCEDRKHFDQQAQLNQLRECAKQASKRLGVRTIRFNDFPDNRMDSVDLLDIIKAIENEILLTNPDLIYTHHHGDVNIDHQLTHKAVIVASRPLPASNIDTLLFFETPSSTEWSFSQASDSFSPNWFVDISEVLHIKLDALGIYEQEMRSWPHPRSLRAVELLAGWRGSIIGRKAAEAFVVGRKIVK